MVASNTKQIHRHHCLQYFNAAPKWISSIKLMAFWPFCKSSPHRHTPADWARSSMWSANNAKLVICRALGYWLFFKVGLGCLRFVWKGLPEYQSKQPPTSFGRCKWLSEETLTTQSQSFSWPATGSKALILYAFSRFLKHILWYIDLRPHYRAHCWQLATQPLTTATYGRSYGQTE